MTTTFRRKTNRLPSHVYRGPIACSLTIACDRRRPLFRDPSLAANCIDDLRRAAEKHDMRVYAYCFMPDHVHLLVQGGPESFIPDFVHDFKGTTGNEFLKTTGGRLWQEGYHDHVLRAYEGLLETARYIAANPVRAGLVAYARDYPYLGSFVWDRGAVVEA